jgi:hypothetical protein
MIPGRAEKAVGRAAKVAGRVAVAAVVMSFLVR